MHPRRTLDDIRDNQDDADPIARAIRVLADLAGTPPDADGSDPALDELRDGIDMLDQAILELLNKRVDYATIIGRIKKAAGEPVYVPRREADVLENVRLSNRGPLGPDAVKRLFERIIDETRSLERKKYQDVERSGEGTTTARSSDHEKREKSGRKPDGGGTPP